MGQPAPEAVPTAQPVAQPAAEFEAPEVVETQTVTEAPEVAEVPVTEQPVDPNRPARRKKS